jgi:hypothetical protein
MPKSTPESDYLKFMTTLQSKIRAEEIGLQSWKGSKRVQIAPVKPSVNDLLTGGEKLNKTQQLQSKMLDEYLEKQKTPITRMVEEPILDEYGAEQYDQYGDVITRQVPKEFKYHEVEPPELDDYVVELEEKQERPPRIQRMYNIDTQDFEEMEIPQSPIVRRVRQRIPVEELPNADQILKQRFFNDLKALDEQIQMVSYNVTQGDEVIRQLGRERTELKQETQEMLRRLVEQYDKEVDEIKLGPLKGRKALIRERKAISNANREDIVRQLEAELRANSEEINRMRTAIRNDTDMLPRLQREKDDIQMQYDNTIAGLNDIMKQNKDKLKAYQQQLLNMNIGGLSTARNIDETDVEYAERLEAIANETVPTARNLEKAIQKNKEELREKLSTVFRDKSMIDNIVNTLDRDDNILLENIAEPLYQLNIQFAGFKTAFEKRYGEFNKDVKLSTVIEEIARYLERRELQLSEELQLIPIVNKLKENVNQPLAQGFESYGFEQSPLSTSSSIPEDSPPSYSLLNPTSSSYVQDPDTGLILPSSMEAQEEGSQVFSSATILPEPLPSAYDVRVLRFVNPPEEDGDPPRIAYLKIAMVKKKNGPPVEVPFISTTGKKGSFREVNYGLSSENGLIPILSRILGTSNFVGFDEKKGGLKKLIEEIGLQRDDGYLEQIADSKGRPIMKGLGLKMSDKVETIPTIINFGLVFLLLRKLYLNNILSIQNNHYKKINGFNNVKVSDTFVEIIQDILNDKNYISKLSQLSQNEREIFDHLLYIAGLHKQLNGGSTADYNKLKKQLEILEGEISAGNNNIALKKQLFNLLQKMAHYKMISSHGAQQHFKQFEQYFK